MMRNISEMISQLRITGYLNPESGATLRNVLAKCNLSWDITKKELESLVQELPGIDTSNFILHEDDLRGKFLEFAPNLAASLVFEQARSNRPDYQQSQRVYFLYMKLCEIYHFDRNCC